ncbi:MAG TPA: DNA-directed RNA polymerase subunit delta [Pseudogracilibacillus sp.]|nr:DNA-directed RNA polymerase subunit delta [Pseudogracilibacillus sp.]
MGLNKYTKEQIEKMPMIELANVILAEEKKELNFLDLFNLVAEQKGLTASQRENFLARFYTDLNVDGRFTTLGNNIWGLKRWYPVDQTSEKSLAEVRKRDAEEESDDELLDEDDELYEEEDDEEVKELYEDMDEYA